MSMTSMPLSVVFNMSALAGDTASSVGKAGVAHGADFQLSLMRQLQMHDTPHEDASLSSVLEALLTNPDFLESGQFNADLTVSDLLNGELDPETLLHLLEQAGISLEDEATFDAAVVGSVLSTWQVLAGTGRGVPESIAENPQTGGGLPREFSAHKALVAALEKVFHGPGTSVVAQSREEGNQAMPQALQALFSRVAAEVPLASGRTDVSQVLTAVSSEMAPSSLAQSTSQTTTPLRALDLDVPVHRPNWGQAVGSRVLWMVNQNVQGAELRLTPPQMGPVEVRIAMEGDRANIQFLAHHAQTREALDAAIPRLREMFADSGVHLGDVDVSGREAGGQGDPAQGQATANPDQDGDGTDSGNIVAGRLATDGSDGAGLLDAYA
ncbi:hypothetical protein CKO35_16550 [Ectothiorhodospira shaposhnikovii]|uniref:flagellar hook-length control protein FliK n=1 Tax=Ectothiorhodospira shaposhnikovii TaxID=1054 RepID=UPI001A923650|nr:flagellar hook-length control protein FliK [Ectothiorhodospira shaposhnikovii]MBK1674866.1 hypothetical protein [Ectothiorhodospira shaposhnikovii]